MRTGRSAAASLQEDPSLNKILDVGVRIRHKCGSDGISQPCLCVRACVRSCVRVLCVRACAVCACVSVCECV